MAETKNYAPGEVIMTFLGTPIVGYGSGTFVSVERNEDAFTLTVGADGEAARTRNANKSGKITFTLLQSSPSNDILSAAAAADELAGAGVGPVLIKDASGRTLVTAPNAWITKLPTVEFGKEHAEREWVLESDMVQMFVGGNG